MGEVYRAQDTRLKRDVAIKLLPDAFSADVERIARFEREAELLAAVSHPNIAQVFGLEGGHGTDGHSATGSFIVMELVEGDVLRPGLPVEEALTIARQIVDALEAAHDRGVIHRDLKPANIKLTPNGQVKVLDFGLAKMLDDSVASSGSAGLSYSPTLSVRATSAGAILGTAAYMSPEQARGKPLDRRTDIWSFGCVLYELLTGARAFEPGDTMSDAIAAVLTREPDFTKLPVTTPPRIRDLLRRCLQKDPQKRLPHIGVARLDIDDARAGVDGSVEAIQTERGSRRRAAVAAVLGLAAGASVALAGAWAAWRPTPPTQARTMRFVITPPVTQPLVSGNPDRNLAIAPDGSWIVYVSGVTGGGGPLMIRAVDRLDATAVGTVTNARFPFVSPDGRWIGFFEGGDLKKVAAGGGAALTICRISLGPSTAPRGASWGPDDSIVFATSEGPAGLRRVPSTGGEPTLVAKPDAASGEVSFRSPLVLPNGRAVLFTVVGSGPIQNARIASLNLQTGERKILVHGGSHPEFVNSGFLIYSSAGSLRAIRFDPERLEVSGDPVAVVEHLQANAAGVGNFAISASGTLAYVSGDGEGGNARTLTWVDRRGREERINAPTRAYVAPRISPDGARVALDIRDQENDIWIWDLTRQSLSRLTFDASEDQYPVWTPDGRALLFASSRTGVFNIFRQLANGTGSAEQLTNASLATAGRALNPWSITRDGSRLIAGEMRPGSGQDISLLGLDADRRLDPLIVAPDVQSNAELSPDGRWIAYQSGESRDNQVYVRPFPDVQAGRWQISTDGGTRPVWARNGKELFFLGRDQRVYAVAIETSGGFSAGNPTVAVNTPYFTGPSTRTFDVSPDSQKFLMIKAEAGQTSLAPTIVLVVNWATDLRQRMSASAP